MEDNKAVKLGSKNQKITAHMFWAKSPISELEFLCMKSFIDKNYKLLVWSYDASLEIPRGAKLRDANIVLDESKLFLNRQGSYAGFSDFFRYKVLDRFGGLYADTAVSYTHLTLPTNREV